MKISVLSVIAVLLLGALPVQSQVVFEETGIKAVFQKAREENKLVFIDCYTSWCGPCKKMLKEVFSRKDIGEYMNTRFVNYKQDMEQEEGKELAGKYGVEVYPTFFILDAAGEVRHKMVGGMTAGEFLKQVQLGSGENSLFAFNHRYRQGERNHCQENECRYLPCSAEGNCQLPQGRNLLYHRGGRYRSSCE